MHRFLHRLWPNPSMSVLLLLLLVLAAPALMAAQSGVDKTNSAQPGCARLPAHACLAQAIDAMGGRAKLEGIHGARFDVIGHQALVEQSYRQDPFITSYEREQTTLDFDGHRLVSTVHAVWPESDPHTADSDVTLIVTAQGGMYRMKEGNAPSSLADLEAARGVWALDPLRLLLTAEAASDLHYEAPEVLRSTAHAVLAFRWNGLPIRVLLNAYNHLPDALESTRTFQDFWFAWGDVRQRIYFDNWQLVQGVVFPTNRVEERNGVLWKSSQLLDVSFNPTPDDAAFVIDAAVAAKSTQSLGWNRTFRDSDRVELAPGVELFKGAWNATLIKHDDGVLVLEAPIAPSYAQGVFARARSEYPGLPIKGVLSTSDSWPHIAGVREAVAEKIPVYALDLNRPLLDRLVAAPHMQHPDALQNDPQRPHWIEIAGKLEVGKGANRVVLYPLRGASTERQYMVYFPEHKLLYASDTLALNPDQSLYDPELMHEVVQAVEREHLRVDRVFAMHQGPTPWRDVVRLVQKATK